MDLIQRQIEEDDRDGIIKNKPTKILDFLNDKFKMDDD